ncbi:hypothetical protein [Domibacillus tundrae]|uniref:hypothetical protein n=1 Tax=Domibacillus tundrae TaxID=1587527 RepID=UPI003395A6EC
MVDRTGNSHGSGIIHHVLTRKSVFVRKVAGSTNDTQVVTTNIDTVMIEKEKINEMFSGMGGMKNAKKFIKEQNRKKSR